MRILIDGDGCPVIPICLELAQRYQIPVILFWDTAHVSANIPGEVKIITVAKGRDSADMSLLQHITPGDIVITQDYGLAALALTRKAICLRQDGLCYTNDNIDHLLESRFLHQKIRAAGGKTKGPSKRSAQQDKQFRQRLEIIIRQQKPTATHPNNEAEK